MDRAVEKINSCAKNEEMNTHKPAKHLTHSFTVFCSPRKFDNFYNQLQPPSRMNGLDKISCGRSPPKQFQPKSLTFCVLCLQGLFRVNPFFFAFHLLHIIGMEIAAYVILYHYGTGWLPWCSALALLVSAQVSMIG